VFAAFIIGVSKTSVGGVATLAVGIFGALMPAKESTAAVLLLLIIGDVIGVLSYHKHADWGLLKKLLPSVLPGSCSAPCSYTSCRTSASRSSSASSSS
jgi:uncharacterized membrane protein YfcA